MVFDMHVHVFPDKIAGKAAGSIGSFYGYAMAHDGTAATLTEEMKKAGVTRALIHSVALTPHQVDSINHFIAETAGKAPEDFVGFGAVHPDYEDLTGLMREVKALGLRGLKIHPDMQRFPVDGDAAMKMFEAISAAGLPVLIHAGDPRFDFSHPEQIKNVAEAFPKMRIIAAHLGGHGEWEKIPALAKCDNVYTDTSSALYFMEAERAVSLIRAYPETHVFFGTDYPMWNPEEELERFLSLPLSEEEKERILYKNAADFFGGRECLPHK